MIVNKNDNCVRLPDSGYLLLSPFDSAIILNKSSEVPINRISPIRYEDRSAIHKPRRYSQIDQMEKYTDSTKNWGDKELRDLRAWGFPGKSPRGHRQQA